MQLCDLKGNRPLCVLSAVGWTFCGLLVGAYGAQNGHISLFFPLGGLLPEMNLAFEHREVQAKRIFKARKS
jgi:hypothetical protein